MVGRWLRSRTAMLFALMAVPAMLEAAALQAVRLHSAIALAPQFGVPGAVGTFHDLRWLLVYHNSWPSFAGILVVAVLGRGVFTAAAVWAAWPDDDPPRLRHLVPRNLVFSLVSVILLSPWAAIALAASETSLSWFLIGEVVPFIIVAVALARGPVAADWWRRPPGLAPTGWTLLLVLVVLAGGMAVAFTSGWWGIPVAGAFAVLSAVVWLQVVRSALRPIRRLSRVPIAAAMVMVVYAALALSGTAATFGSSTAGDVRGSAQAFAAPSVALIYVGGYDSDYDGTPMPGPAMAVFSYQGLNSAGRPLPYGTLDTHQSVDRSAQLLARQVTTFHDQTGLPVALVAESEGTVVLRDYLDTLPHPDVDAAVMMSPLVRPGRIYYPPPDATTGWGLAAGWELRGILGLVGLTNSSQISADEPFVRSILDRAPLYRDRMLCPVPGVRLVAFLPTAEAAVVPPDLQPEIPVFELPGVHASLGSRPDVQADVREFLSGHPPADHQSGPGYAIIQKAAAAWQAPALPIRLNPAWPGNVPDASLGDDGCAYSPG